MYLALCIMQSLAVALHAMPAAQDKSKHKGRDRIFTIMYSGDHGVKNYNKNIVYAQNENLIEDIALPRVAMYFPTSTDLGQTFLLDTLSFPISPKDTTATIARRKVILKNLFEDKNLKAAVDQQLQTIKTAEAQAMELMINRNKAIERLTMRTESALGPLGYLVKPWMMLSRYTETNPWINLANQGKNTLTAAGLGLTSATNAKLAYKEFTDPQFTFFNLKEIDKAQDAMYGKNSEQSAQDRFEDFVKYSSGKKYFTQQGHDALSYTGGALLSGEMAYSTAQGVYSNYETGLERQKLIHALHKLVVAAEKLEQLCKEQGLEPQFKPSLITDPKGLAMLKNLKSSQYQSQDTAFYMTPWVNTFINEIYQEDIHLAPYFALIAEMDAYHAIATQMVATENTENQFCFAQFIQTGKPTIKAHKIWNVVVNNPVANDFNESRSIILTGANAGGKSTMMRSILQNILLAQTFGIAAGKSFELTPFDVINSYLHITDNVEKGLSRYAAELHSANEIVEQAKTLRPDEKFFFVIDELFTGTGGKEGETLAFEFINDDLAPYLDRTQLIFATHFEKLKEIEATNPQRFANYKINPPIVGPDGKLIYPFTMEKGINNTNIAALMKREAGLLGKNKTRYA